MDDSQLPSPHNNFFHFAFSHASAVRSLIETHMPSSIAQSLNLQSLELLKGSFVDENLRETHSDLLYSAPWINEIGQNTIALVYLLFEHKSHSDKMTGFQLLRYIVQIWEQAYRNGTSLYPIFPLVIHHGEKPWNSPRSLDALIGTPEALLPYSVRFSFPILDLCVVPDDKLSQDPFLQSALSLLKYSRRKELVDRLETILRQLLVDVSIEAQTARLKAAVYYILASNPNIPVRTLTMTVQKILPSRIEPGSIADQLLKEGRMEGRQEGLQEGLQEGVIQGEIRLIQSLQKVLRTQVSDTESLKKRPLEELKSISRDLQSQAEKLNNN